MKRCQQENCKMLPMILLINIRHILEIIIHSMCMKKDMKYPIIYSNLTSIVISKTKQII